MNNTPTPETDAVIDSDMGDSTHLSDMEALCRKLERERDQLRKVVDELAKELEWYWEPMPEGTFHPDNPIGQKSIAIELYNQLPHVIERKTK